MFKQLKNIDTAFKHVRLFTIVVIIACVFISGFSLMKSYQAVQTAQSRIYILSHGKVLEAISSTRKENIEIEAKDHVKTFHQYFFGLDPDDDVIQTNISKALYLADQSAKSQFDNLKEKGYYSNIISANISQKISVDSVVFSSSEYPYYFRCYATQQLIRSSSSMNRMLITEGFLRNVSRSDNNPHGFLIERWKILSNSDITSQNQ